MLTLVDKDCLYWKYLWIVRVWVHTCECVCMCTWVFVCHQKSWWNLNFYDKSFWSYIFWNENLTVCPWRFKNVYSYKAVCHIFSNCATFFIIYFHGREKIYSVLQAFAFFAYWDIFLELCNHSGLIYILRGSSVII